MENNLIVKNTDAEDQTWQSVSLITTLSRIAALFHDFGKINPFFAKKLKQAKSSKKIIADPFRHEWISLRLFEAFVKSHDCSNDLSWVNSLMTLSPQTANTAWLSRMLKDGVDTGLDHQPFVGLPAVAQLVAWLIVSHHRLPILQSIVNVGDYAADKFDRIFEDIDFKWCYPSLFKQANKNQEKEIQQCWDIKAKDIPFYSQTWCKEMNACAKRLIQLLEHDELSRSIFACTAQDDQGTQTLNDPYLSHISRMVLMLSDHYYSKRDSNTEWHDPSYKPYANTDRLGNLKQHLDDHLVGVSQSAAELMQALPHLNDLFRGLAPQAALALKTENSYFQWQDVAYQLARDLGQQYPTHGFFGVNLASTGRGKTLANTKIMYGLADPKKGARFNIALGLRTLTLQTGQALREKLNLTEADLAVMVGGGAVKELFERANGTVQSEDEQSLCAPILDPEQNSILAEKIGSESLSGLHTEGLEVDFSDQLPKDHVFAQWLKDNEQIQKMLMSPILCCTIDHLIPATESTRGGGQIAPMLRLMSSDLVIDEPDEFSTDDYYALSRLVYWAGLMGSRVLLSSATLMPSEVNGLYLAYSSGRKAFNLHRTQPDQPIIAAWFDENAASIGHALIPCNQANNLSKPHHDFIVAHDEFTRNRVEFLDEQAGITKRWNLEWVGLPKQFKSNQKWEQMLATHTLATTLKAHQLNAITDPITQKKYSVGLVRFANIDPLATIAQQLLKQDIPSDVRIHLCVYHSRFPLLMRNHIEQYLDAILDRNGGKQPHDHDLIQGWLNQYPEQEHIIVVLASPVCEVGRDHDYDWLILEPSSVRSGIQASGRIRRHRPEDYAHANIFVMETNTRHYRRPSSICFAQPGFENDVFRTQQHDLKWSAAHLDDGLISKADFNQLDSRARLRPNHPDEVREKYKNGYYRLADLEHDRMMHIMLNQGLSERLDRETAYGEAKVEFPVYRFWDSPIQYTGVLQRMSMFRKSQAEFLVAFSAQQETTDLQLYQHNPDSGNWSLKENFLRRIKLQENAQINCWPNNAPQALLLKYLDTTKNTRSWQDNCARYLSLNLPKFEAGKKWQYHDWLGFIRE